MNHALFISFYLLLYLGCFSNKVLGQKQNNIWYFGDKAGLDFNAGGPVPLLDGEMSIFEGCAVVSDEEGKLLFYTDGQKVWNREHRVMPGGEIAQERLKVELASTQNAIIVPWPDSDHLFYIFYVDWQASSGGLRYAIVDIFLDNGLGVVTDKELQLLSPTTEKLTSVLHFNKKEIWVLTHAWNSNEFYAYLITEVGLNAQPVISAVGKVHEGGSDWGNPNENTIGYMKVSPDGKKIALAVFQDHFVEVFDFNNQTGEVSNPVTYDIEGLPYGIEFSPDSKLLYISAYDAFEEISLLYQYDLPADHASATEHVIATSEGYMGALQLGPDHKIYVVINGYEHLSVIHNPNLPGAACHYEEDAVFLNGRISYLGLPAPVHKPWDFIPEFTYEDTCYSQQTHFFLTTPDVESVTWNFGDEASGELNISDDINPIHLFSAPGEYEVSVTIVKFGEVYTHSQILHILELPEVELGNDTTLYYGESLLLEAGVGDEYLWQDGSTGSSFTVNESGIYWVDASNTSGCTLRDSITVFYDQIIDVGLGEDTTLCTGETLVLDVTLPEASFQWQDGSTNPSFTVSDPGVYWVDITNAYENRTQRDSIVVTYVSEPALHDTTVCSSESVELQLPPLQTGLAYQWYAEEDAVEPLAQSDQLLTDLLDEVTTFYIAVTNGICESERVPFQITFEPPQADAGRDITITSGEEVQLQAWGGVAYQWQPEEGLSDSTIPNPMASPDQTTTYTVTVTTEEGCTATDEVTIYVVGEQASEEALNIPNVFTPNGDGVNDKWNIQNIERYPDCLVKIYDRWGLEVFSSKRYQSAWDGIYRGNLLPGDVYFFVINLGTDVNKSPVTGNVTLIR